eukprot:113093_1
MQLSISIGIQLNSLSTEQFDSFWTQLIAENSDNKQELLTKLISNSTANECINSLNTPFTHQVHGILEDIIDSATDNTNGNDNDINDISENNEISIPANVDNLSSELIAMISSYLRGNEAFTLMLANKHVFVACKKFTTSITNLTKNEWFKKYSTYTCRTLEKSLNQLTQFRNVQDLKISVEDLDVIYPLAVVNCFWMGNVMRLCIYQRRPYPTQFYSSWLTRHKHVLQSLNKLEYFQIQLRLRAKFIWSVPSLLSIWFVNKNVKFLNICPQAVTVERIGCLSAKGVCGIDEIVNQLIKPMQNLTGFKMSNYVGPDDKIKILFTALLKNMCNVLESYHIQSLEPYYIQQSLPIYRYSHMEQIWSDSNFELPKLKELCIIVEGRLEDCHFVKSIRKAIVGFSLKRLHISITRGNTRSNELYAECGSFIAHLLKTQPTLRFISIRGMNMQILNSIGMCLTNENIVINKEFKLQFFKWYFHKLDYPQIEKHIFNVIDLISKKKNKAEYVKFLIKFELPCSDQNDKLIQKIKRLQQTFNIYRSDEFWVVSSKNDCFPNGFRERWDMSCEMCGKQ